MSAEPKTDGVEAGNPGGLRAGAPAEEAAPAARGPVPKSSKPGSALARRPRVFLVGAGPGDPDLISVRAVRCLERADVVLYDRLVDPGLLDHAPSGAERVYVGKRSADHTVPQPGINELIVDYARQGKTVVRLKGGDPFIFGRGGEEGIALHEAGIPFEVVPGISAGYGVPAYAGIPVTHRGLTSHVTFVTGHEDPDKQSAEIDWDRLASDVGTLVVFMGVKNLPTVVRELRERGRPGDTPIALIRYGTLPAQRTVVGVLDDIVEKVAAAKLRPPAITVIGDVVRLREQLSWFEERPLFGRRVVVTRPRAQAAGQIELLRELGAEVIPFPTIRIEPVAASPEIDAMTAALSPDGPAYDLVVFTSVNGVHCFFDRLREAGRDARALAGATVVAIGPKTAAACRARGVLPDVVPVDFVAEGVLEALAGRDLSGARILIPRAREARELLPEAFAAAGASVEVVPLYDTVLEEHGPETVERVLGADYVTFTSSSTVSNFAALMRAAGRGDELPRVAAASIGPVTSETVRAEGMELLFEAAEYTVEGLVEGLLDHALVYFPGSG
ncbi:MAG: uroporphyrinogen-III C-methyltransferase [Thermoleophilia bacterium]